MRIYADLPARRSRQIVVDVLGVAWCFLAVVVGWAVHDAIAILAGPGRELEESGTGIAGSLQSAADRLAGLPLVGDEVSAPVSGAADAARGVADAGRAAQDYVATAALVVGLTVALTGLLAAAVVWILPRALWVRQAAAVRAALADPDGVDLLALRALATAPVSAVARLGDGLMDAWRRGDADVVNRLASYELARLGLRPLVR